MTGNVTRTNVVGIMQELEATMAFKEQQVNVVNAYEDLWLSRTQGMLVVAFKRSIESGTSIPKILMKTVFIKVFSMNLVLRLAKQYAVAIAKPFICKVSL